MGKAKEITLKVIPGKIAKPYIEKHHYSKKAVNNSCLHFGAFLDGNLHGGPFLRSESRQIKNYNTCGRNRVEQFPGIKPNGV